jgi:hypothetical protein
MGIHLLHSTNDSCHAYRRLTLYRLVGEYACKDIMFLTVQLKMSGEHFFTFERREHTHTSDQELFL